MTIDERMVGPVAVLALGGRLVLGEGDEPLKGRVRELTQQGVAHIMLDMAGVTYVDSAGLGALVGVSLAARSHGRAITLVSPSTRLLELLAVAKLRNVVTVATSAAEALGNLPLS